MTKQACAEFFAKVNTAKVNTDTALQQDFLKAIEGKEDESMLMDAAHSVAEVGTKYGYDFTAEEVAQTLKEIKEKAAMEGEGEELSDEALELVAGGATTTTQKQMPSRPAPAKPATIPTVKPTMPVPSGTQVPQPSRPGPKVPGR